VIEIVEECRGWTFQRGRRDCCTFVAYVVHRLTGRNLLDDFPDYTTKAGAEKILADCGGWEGMLDKVLPRIKPLQASRGDVVLMDDEIGICVGTAVAAMTQDGLTYYPAERITAAWAKQ